MTLRMFHVEHFDVVFIREGFFNIGLPVTHFNDLLEAVTYFVQKEACLNVSLNIA